jgi:predicted metal-dependent peptidase
MSHGTVTTVRPLNPGEQEALRLARLCAADAAPYFMHAVFAMRAVAAPGLGTFAVDRFWRLYLDPAQLTAPGAWSPAEAGGVLLHEAGHLLRDHCGRVTGLPQPVVKLAWNLATDAEINDDLIAARLTLPPDLVTPGGLGLPDGGIAEDYYAALADPARAAWLATCDDGSCGCGSGAGGPAVPGELPEASPTAASGGGAQGLGQAEGDLIRRRVAEDVKAHAKGRGTVPAGLDRWASAVLAPPVVPWSQVLRGAIRSALAGQAGRTDYTYSRPSRRRLPRIIKPAMRGRVVTVTVVADTSGSMSEADLAAALSEIAGVLRAAGVARDRVCVLACDAAASAPRRVRSVADVRLTGGGGTDMRVGIAAASAARPRPDVIVVLTDGYTPWPDVPTRARLVCGIISPHPPEGTPPWATTVHIPAAT